MFDVILLTDTWLTNSIHNGQLFTNYYNVVRSDRQSSLVSRARGGDVLIAIANCISFNVIDTSSITDLTPFIDLRTMM